MSDTNREEILATFQSITAIDDVAEAIYHLEESDWDLLAAVHKVLPQDTNSGPVVNNITSSSPTSSFAPYLNQLNNFDDIANIDELMTAPPSPSKNNTNIAAASLSNFNASDMLLTFMDVDEGIINSEIPGPSTSRNTDASTNIFNMLDTTKTQDITFSVHFNDRTHKINISNQATVGDLKLRIQEQTTVPVCRQALKGWVSSRQREALNDTSVLKSLNVSKDNALILTDITEDGIFGDINDIFQQQAANQIYTLHINLQPEGKMFVLKYPGTHTILKVKTDVYSITDIQVRHQIWSGWPNNVTGTTTLAEAGIELDHNLVLKKCIDNLNKNSNNNRNRVNNGIIEIDSDSSIEEFEDASDFNGDDDLFAEAPPQNRIKHLIPDQIDDETIGCIQFVENYVERYGPQHPMFFQGSLEDALKEAVHKPAKDRKLLAIYLHHDRSVLTNVFCGQLLSCDTIIQLLLDNFVIYGWDLTYESNKNMFLSSVSACVGVTASITVRNIAIDHLPAILIVAKNRSVCEVFSVIYGNVGVDDLLSQLMESTELYSEQLRVEIREENDRNAREQVKMEQDVAYRESLEIDRAKEEAKRQKELMIQTERRRAESERAEIEAKKEAIRLEAENSLPAEPSVDTPNITKLRFRKPTGEFAERRFKTETKLRILLNFVTSLGFPIDEYKVISSWPRRDLTTITTDETLHSLKLYPQETVILEER